MPHGRSQWAYATVFGLKRSVRNIRLPLRVDACPLYHDSGIRILEHDVVAGEAAYRNVTRSLREEIAPLAAERREDLDPVLARGDDHAVGAACIGVSTDERSRLIEEIERRRLERHATGVAHHAGHTDSLSHAEVEHAVGVAERHPVRVVPGAFP